MTFEINQVQYSPGKPQVVIVLICTSTGLFGGTMHNVKTTQDALAALLPGGSDWGDDEVVSIATSFLVAAGEVDPIVVIPEA